jgi:hypothetical protein
LTRNACRKIYTYGASIYSAYMYFKFFFFGGGGEYIRPQNDSFQFFVVVNTGLALEKCDSLQCCNISPNPMTTTAPNNIITRSYH